MQLVVGWMFTNESVTACLLIFGASGKPRKTIRTFVTTSIGLLELADGETDVEVLAEMAKGRMRNKIPELQEALRGMLNATQRRLLAEQLAQVAIGPDRGRLGRVAHQGQLPGRSISQSTASPGQTRLQSHQRNRRLRFIFVGAWQPGPPPALARLIPPRASGC